MAVEQKKNIVDAYLKAGIYVERDGKIYDKFNGTEIIPIEVESTNNDSNTIINVDNANKKEGNPSNTTTLGFPNFAQYGLNLIDQIITAGDNLEEERERAAKLERQKQFESIRSNRLKKYGRKKQGGILRYPAELITEHADYLQIDIERYAEIGKTNYISNAGGSSRYVIGNKKTNRAGQTTKLSSRPLINDGTILLPIPSNVSDANNVSYGESRMNGLTAAGVSAAEGLLKSNNLSRLLEGESLDLKELDVAGKKIKTMMGGDESTAAMTAADVITKQLTAAAVNIFDANVTPNQLLARSNGEIINPNLEILFSDVTLRSFAFRYKLTPRNQKEADQVKLIIRAFKRNMAPQAIGSDGASDFFLRSPNVFKLRYRSGNKDHPFLNKFKQCFLTDMQTRYTGDGVYSTYDDGTPVSIELNLSFKELQPIYDIDYDEFPGTRAVGY
tara:strand:- start:1207 stop:2541 length:1335 start_codon:yes stop_codon:yes gene_type:complete